MDSTQATHPSPTNQISKASSNSKINLDKQHQAKLLPKMTVEPACSTQTSSRNCSRYSNSWHSQTSEEEAPILKLRTTPASKTAQLRQPLEMVAWEVKRSRVQCRSTLGSMRSRTR